MATAAALSAPAAAQSSDWRFEGSLYVFVAETDLTLGDTTATLSFSDALDNLDVAGMAAFRATNKKWSFVADLLYFDLGFENEAGQSGEINTDQRNTILSGYALYRVYDAPTVAVDLGGGVRYFRTNTDITVTGDQIETQNLGTDDSWTDPLIAAQARFKLSDRWSSLLAVDYGNFVSERETYGVTLTFDYALSDAWLLRAGYRYINVENDGRDPDFRFEQSGPLIGFTYRF